jgi:peptidoglycan/LPS O-acetylase OafA/YrhL
VLQKNPENSVKLDPVTGLNLIFLSVVLLLHHVNYTQDYLWEITHRLINVYAYKIDKVLQMFAVGGFLFLSGFKIAGSKSAETATGFITSRLLRIYPLYFLALVVSSFTSYPYLTKESPSIANFLLHALCLQSVLPDCFQLNYNTIWFVSNLMCCYLLFLLLRPHINHPRQFFTTLTIVLIALAGLRFLATIAHVQLFTGDFDTYLIFFSLGVFYSRYQTQIRQLKIKPWLFTTPIAIVGFLVAKNALGHQPLWQYCLERVFILSAMIPLYCILLRGLGQITITQPIAKLLQNLTIASFCVFLFHRSWWAILATVWSQKSYTQSLFILGCGIPLCFVISYWLQISYDRHILARFRTKPKGIIPQS